MDTSRRVRGYCITAGADYLRSAAGEAEANRALGETSPELQRAIKTAKAADWHPVALQAELYRTIASVVGRGKEDKAREALIECGKFTAREATNTYLRLLMKMLSPSLFAKKMPEFWRRDNSGGVLKVEMKDQKLVCHVSDVSGHDHIGPIAAGFAVFAFEQMGKKVEGVAVNGWSLDNPSANCVCEVAWR